MKWGRSDEMGSGSVARDTIGASDKCSAQLNLTPFHLTPFHRNFGQVAVRLTGHAAISQPTEIQPCNTNSTSQTWSR